MSLIGNSSLSKSQTLTLFSLPCSFGAVIEEFEVRDGLLALFAEKAGKPTSGPFFAPQEVPVYA